MDVPFAARFFCFLVVGAGLLALALHASDTSIPYRDALFMSVSVLTSTGLAVVNYTKFNTAGQIILFCGMLTSSTMLLAAVPSLLYYRRCRRQEHHITHGDGATDNNHIDSEAASWLRGEGNVAWLIVVLSCGTWLCLVFTAFLLLCVKFDPRWALFLSVSCVNNVGLSPSEADFVHYRNDLYTIGIFICFMPLGNTLFPLVFRAALILWHHVAADRMLMWSSPATRFLGLTWLEWSRATESLRQSPRKYFAHFFSPRETAMLLLLWVSLTVVEFLMFVPEYNTSIFPTGFDLSEQMLLAMFQTVTVRTSGFSVFTINTFRVGHIAFWIFAMYVSAYPLMLSARVANRGLNEVASCPTSPVNSSKREGLNLHRFRDEATVVAGRDLIWLYAAVVAISFSEDSRVGMQRDPSFFLRTCFEVSSAFGNVGLSLGRKSEGVVSFSEEFNSFSRWIIVLLMLAGKLRGLPASSDTMTSLVPIAASHEALPTNGSASLEEMEERSPTELTSLSASSCGR